MAETFIGYLCSRSSLLWSWSLKRKGKGGGKKGKIKTHLEDKAGKTPCSHEVYQSILSLVLTVVSIIFAGKFWGGIGTRTSYKTKHNSLAEI